MHISARYQLGLLFVSAYICRCTVAPCAEESSADDPPQLSELSDTEDPAQTLSGSDEALASISLPAGFEVSLFASEPMVRQPIGMAMDAKGRLWVAENYTYAEQKVGFERKLHDRIVILEDRDGDGKCDEQRVFWDQASKLTSIEVGLGGVWALCPPKLLFLPDANHDEQLDGEPIVMLDGFDEDRVRHNIANGLRWGPDGWLYGRHGILATSHVGTPETPPDQRTALNCSIWRFHPVRKTFEVVTHGTTNPWGMDWDEHGQLFFVNTVIGHLWHVIPGAHYQRMYGDDFNPNLYRLMSQTADHVHWDTGEDWKNTEKLGLTLATDQAGGGHAHSGLMIYLGDNWPDQYRGRVYMNNFHGRRINCDLLERRGAGYVGRHESDFLRIGDRWFRGIELLYGPDGGVYISDWSDVGECHEADGVHRNSGRIYKVTYGQPAKPALVDLAVLGDAELIRLNTRKNEWFARQARQVLYDRSAAGRDMRSARAALQTQYAAAKNVTHRLRALWCLQVTGGVDAEWLIEQLRDSNEHIRVWAVKLLAEGSMTSRDIDRLAEMAANDESGLVLVYIASALQGLPIADRWDIATALARRDEFANDPTLPLMIWYGIETAVPAMPDQALKLLETATIPLVRRHIVRRLAADLKHAPQPLERLGNLVAETSDVTWQRDALGGLNDALRGWRSAQSPPLLKQAIEQLATSSNDDLQQIARELLVVFGDGRAEDELRALALAEDADPVTRRQAIEALVASRAQNMTPLLQQLIQERDLARAAIRGLAAYDDPHSAELIIARYERLHTEARGDAIGTLASRPAYARMLLAAVTKGVVGRDDVPAFQIRQMWSYGEEDIRDQLRALWPHLRQSSDDKSNKIAAYSRFLAAAQLDAADVSQGRLLFQKSCASCHRLFGDGGSIGPDLTGAQRTNLAFLLNNIVDPSSELAENFRMWVIVLADGRVLNGIVAESSTQTITLQTANERLVIDRDDIDEMEQSKLSIMPDQLLEALTDGQIRDLIAYLMSPRQVPLPE